jgi:hypothetical protein
VSQPTCKAVSVFVVVGSKYDNIHLPTSVVFALLSRIAYDASIIILLRSVDHCSMSDEEESVVSQEEEEDDDVAQSEDEAPKAKAKRGPKK